MSLHVERLAQRAVLVTERLLRHNITDGMVDA